MPMMPTLDCDVVLDELHQAGVSLAWHKGKLRYWIPSTTTDPDSCERLIVAHAEDLRRLLAPDGPAVAWRLTAMRVQVPATPAPIPILQARPGAYPAGRCLSCGDPVPLDESTRTRCGPCVLAAWQAVEGRLAPEIS